MDDFKKETAALSRTLSPLRLAYAFPHCEQLYGLSGRGACVCVAGGGGRGSWSAAGFSAPLLASTAAALSSGSASTLFCASSLSSASFGASSQAPVTSGAALGLPGRGFAAAGWFAGAFTVALALSAEEFSSLLSLLRDVSFSTRAFKTQRERGVSSASGSPFTTAEDGLDTKRCFEGLVLPVSAWGSSSELTGLVSGIALSSRSRGSSAPTEEGLLVRGGLTLELEPSESSVFTCVASAAVDCLESDPEFRASFGDLELVVKARGRICWLFEGEPAESRSPSSKTVPCISAPSS